MKKIVLATTNQHKLQEIKDMLSDVEIVSLADIGFTEDIEENGKTTGENAKIKAMAILKYCKEKGLDYGVLADDSGLFVNSLHGEPGIYSARYASSHDDNANRKKLLDNLANSDDRLAYFECSMCYVDRETVRIFVGRTYGSITKEEIGKTDFGYDCLFYSSDLKKTFGEATEEEKNQVSHRSRAIEKFKHFLQNKNPNLKYIVEYNKK